VFQPSTTQDKRVRRKREEYNEAKQSCGWNVPELQTTFIWLPLVRDRRARAATTADFHLKCGSATDKKTVKKLIIFFIVWKTV
jgi:hypothetical protein